MGTMGIIAVMIVIFFISYGAYSAVAALCSISDTLIKIYDLKKEERKPFKTISRYKTDPFYPIDENYRFMDRKENDVYEEENGVLNIKSNPDQYESEQKFKEDLLDGFNEIAYKDNK